MAEEAGDDDKVECFPTTTSTSSSATFSAQPLSRQSGPVPRPLYTRDPCDGRTMPFQNAPHQRAPSIARCLHPPCFRPICPTRCLWSLSSFRTCGDISLNHERSEDRRWCVYKSCVGRRVLNVWCRSLKVVRSLCSELRRGVYPFVATRSLKVHNSATLMLQVLFAVSSPPCLLHRRTPYTLTPSMESISWALNI